MMQYKGYIASIEYDDKAEIFHGEVLNVRDVITFHGRTVSELKKALKGSVEDYLEFCKSRGESPEEPYPGRFAVRLDPSLHRRLNAKGQCDGCIEAAMKLLRHGANPIKLLKAMLPQRKRGRPPKKTNKIKRGRGAPKKWDAIKYANLLTFYGVGQGKLAREGKPITDKMAMQSGMEKTLDKYSQLLVKEGLPALREGEKRDITDALAKRLPDAKKFLSVRNRGEKLSEK
jgi:predicted HicB family RNase H-like nuclease